MADLNKVMILGNVGKDPEIRYTPNGTPQTTFSVATNRVYKRPDGEQVKETEWFNVVLWAKLAEQMANMLQRGDRIYVEGRLHTRSWEGQDGKRQYRTEVIGDRVLLQGRRQQPVAAGYEGGNGYGHADVAGDMTDPDDLPFD